MKFKAGDRVQFKTWEEMEKEFGLDNYGNISPKHSDTSFVKNMKFLCGAFATVKKTNGRTVYLTDISVENKSGWKWCYSEYMLKPATDKYELHIISDGKTTNAVYKKNGKVVARSQARKHSDDEFNFETGAFMAADRIFHTEKKDSKPELYLYNTFNEKHYGVVGKQTNFKDKNGRPLFVGDVVEIVSEHIKCTQFVVYKEYEYFVYGILDACNHSDGTFDGFEVTLLKPYTQIKPGEQVDDIIVKVK